MSIGPKTTLTLSTKSSSDDGMGGRTYIWTSSTKIEGVFSTLSDRERMMYGKKAEAATHKFVVNYQFASSVVTMDRFVLGARTFEIISKENPVNQNRFLIFLLEEKVNG